jgi:hypothetical protein
MKGNTLETQVNLSDQTNPIGFNSLEAREETLRELCGQFNYVIDSYWIKEMAELQTIERLSAGQGVITPYEYNKEVFQATICKKPHLEWLIDSPIVIKDSETTEHHDSSVINQDEEVGQIVSPIFTVNNNPVDYSADPQLFGRKAQVVKYNLAPCTLQLQEGTWLQIQAQFDNSFADSPFPFYFRTTTLLRFQEFVDVEEWVNEFVKANQNIDGGYVEWKESTQEKIELNRQAKAGAIQQAKEALTNWNPQ